MTESIFTGIKGTQEEAAEAYDIAAIKFRGTNAVTNFDISRYDVKRICSSSTLIAGDLAKRGSPPKEALEGYGSCAVSTDPNCPLALTASSSDNPEPSRVLSNKILSSPMSSETCTFAGNSSGDFSAGDAYNSHSYFSVEDPSAKYVEDHGSDRSGGDLSGNRQGNDLGFVLQNQGLAKFGLWNQSTE